MQASSPLRLSVAAALVSAALAGPAFGQTAQEAELLQRVDKLAAELQAVKAQLAQLQSERQAERQRSAEQPAPATASAAAPPTPAPAATTASSEPATVLTGYGEINYNRTTKHSENSQADLRRFVLGYQHRFDEKTKLVTELEVEHAIASSSDQGEAEIEQAFIDHQINPTWSLRGGLMLMPAGLLNENHEPTAYYGVERNFVETAIIPSTWREGGVQAVANLDNGLTLQGGLSTGFNLGKWDATSTEGAASPLGSIHQEMQLAKAHDIAAFGAANWRGVPGLLLGASLFSGGATQGEPGKPSSRVTLWDLHARWAPGAWDLSGVYARGGISNTTALNKPLAGSATLIPETFYGWYAQAAYKLWSSGDYSLSPFVRYERYNTGSAYADIGAGLTPNPRPTERVVTLGANFKLNSSVVIKADVQRFKEASDNDRFDLGLGWSF